MALALPRCGGTVGDDTCDGGVCIDAPDIDDVDGADSLDSEGELPTGEICGDGIDNDGDGLADCADQDCASVPACATCATDGRTLCGDECVDTTSDPRHCGSCGNACTLGDLCVASACQAGADCRVTPCTGFTYCNLADGRCTPGCATSGQCGSNQSCDVASHECVCNAGFHSCTGMCFSNGSPASCGSLCEPCPGDPYGYATCDGSVCAIACNAGALLCGGRCAPCPGGGASVVSCAADQCVCASGYHDCGGSCASNSSVATCGSGCTPCAPPENAVATCDGFSCGHQCDGGYHDCSGACVSSTAPEHCGTRCDPCPAPDHTTPTCTAGACGYDCVPGYVPCPGGCCEHCSTAGCTGVTWCNSATGLCEAGCTRHDQCDYGYFCYLTDHDCVLTVDGSCPAGYTYRGMCSDGSDFCVHSGLPEGTQYVFVDPCPTGTTERGYFYCSDYTRVCVPD